MPYTTTAKSTTHYHWKPYWNQTRHCDNSCNQLIRPRSAFGCWRMRMLRMPDVLSNYSALRTYLRELRIAIMRLCRSFVNLRLVCLRRLCVRLGLVMLRGVFLLVSWWLKFPPSPQILFSGQSWLGTLRRWLVWKLRWSEELWLDGLSFGWDWFADSGVSGFAASDSASWGIELYLAGFF